MDIEIEKIIRTKRRKNITLQITDNATLIVKAPYRTDNKTIEKIVYKHKNWIIRKKREIEEKIAKSPPKQFINNEKFLYLGTFYKLNIVDNQKKPLKFNNGFYISKNVLPQAKEVFISWYKKKAYEKISEKIEWYVQKYGFEYRKIGITNAKHRWGSCSFFGNLNFPWRLIMAPISVIDYVIVHELTHLEIKNHSKAFWDKVELLMPEYKKQVDWLRENGYLLKL